MDHTLLHLPWARSAARAPRIRACPWLDQGAGPPDQVRGRPPPSGHQKTLHDQHRHRRSRGHSIRDTTQHEAFEASQTTRSQDDDIALLLGRCVENHRGHITLGQLGLIGHTGSCSPRLGQGQDTFSIGCQTEEAICTAWPLRLHVQQTHHELLRTGQL